ncbi:MAG: hypothetical protein GAK43_01792 [Stenotrophomonas maltophilia]|nr:MAG: hypothetical protein GAK43_01792 [Stenotrophomonas maltophilia]
MMRITVLLALCAVASLARAADPEPAPGTAQHDAWEIEHWMQLQSSGKLASNTPQTATPAERDRAYQRYLNSYTHPIPENLFEDNQSFTSGRK